MADAILHHYLVWEFPSCTVRHFPLTQYTETVFADGAKVPAAPEDTEEYRKTARDLGYGEDTNRLCLEHEIGHTFLAIKAGEEYSRVLWDVAHGLKGNAVCHVLEEQRVLDWQAYLNGQMRPRHSYWKEWAEEFRRFVK